MSPAEQAITNELLKARDALGKAMEICEVNDPYAKRSSYYLDLRDILLKVENTRFISALRLRGELR